MPASFPEALEKLSFELKPRAKQEVKVEKHFESFDPDWKAFVKNLRSKSFQEIASQHPMADEKLKLYVKNFGGYLRSKDHVATVKSKDSGKSYKIKKVGQRLGCNCGDWQYKHSVQGGDCKHIQSLKQSKMKLSAFIKQAFMNDLKTMGAGMLYMRHLRKKYWGLGQQSKAFADQKRDEERERFTGT